MANFTGMKTTDGISGVVFKFDMSDVEFNQKIDELKNTYKLAWYFYDDGIQQRIYDEFKGIDEEYDERVEINPSEPVNATMYTINANSFGFHYPSEHDGMLNWYGDAYDDM